MTALDEDTLARLLKEAVPEAEPSTDLAGSARTQAARRRRQRSVAAGVLAAVVVVLVPVLALTLHPGNGGGGTGPATGPTHTVPTPDSALCGRACNPVHVADAIRQPLHLPTVAGGSCPVSPRRTFPGGAGFTGPFRALGAGHLFVAGLSRGGTVPVSPDSAGRLSAKVIWVFGKQYGGPLLLRGDRVDGPGRLRFEHYLGAADYPPSGPGVHPHRQVLYVRGGLHAPAPHALESEPDELYVDGPGCYAVQADGVGFSEVLVFRVPGR